MIDRNVLGRIGWLDRVLLTQADVEICQNVQVLPLLFPLLQSFFNHIPSELGRRQNTHFF